MPLSIPIPRLRRQARTLARDEAIRLHAALDRLAASEGYRGWSHLVAHHPAERGEPGLSRLLTPGALVLIAARPHQGKTRLGLDLALGHARKGQDAIFFTLDFTDADVARTLRDMGHDPARAPRRFATDTSDDITAATIIARLRAARPPALGVVDYLQLLDQRRTAPPLQEQISALHDFARQTGHSFAILSQIDRKFTTRSAHVPTHSDIHLPNPLDLTLFSRTVFLQDGQMTIS